jgi:4-hydroxy-3-polyprenylbenzoate decarboxylase
MVAITGASGAVYARRLLEVLPEVYDRIYLTRSDNAIAIMQRELKTSDVVPPKWKDRFTELDSGDMFAPTASGSHDYDGLVIIPCSMGVVGRIASGVSNDLVTRAADVCLKERRKLVLVVRETPLSLIHLRNLTNLAEAGAIVLPAAPAFYQNPSSIADLVDFIVDRVLRALDLDLRLTKGWGE